jgi:diadenylate cyclase
VEDTLWLLSRLNLSAIVDIFLVALIFYAFLMLVKDTQADQLVRGILFVILLSFIIANGLKLTIFNWLLRSALPALIVAIPIIFQPELRRFLEQVGRRGAHPLSLRPANVENVEATISEICHATARLAENRWGALIVLQRETGLEDYVETGQRIDGLVSERLLTTIFFPNTPLHDKAVVIRGDRVLAASCVLPLSENVPEGEGLGTRHAAAIGVTEATDAVCIVVSEETGIISLARGGSLLRHLDEGKLQSYLLNLFLREALEPTLSWLPLRHLALGRRESHSAK